MPVTVGVAVFVEGVEVLVGVGLNGVLVDVTLGVEVRVKVGVKVPVTSVDEAVTVAVGVMLGDDLYVKSLSTQPFMLAGI